STPSSGQHLSATDLGNLSSPGLSGSALAGFAPGTTTKDGNYIMKQTWKPIVAWGALLGCLLVGVAFGGSDKVKVKGLITTRTGEALIMKTAGGDTVTVVLTDSTKVQQPKGL